jgi:heat shock protein HtpX
MPFSFVTIEKRKKRVIAFLFLFVVLFYLAVTFLIAVILRAIILLINPQVVAHFFSLEFLLFTFGFAIVFAVLHWLVSISNAKEMIIRVLGARPPDKNDTHHKQLQNIVDEVSIASGGKKINCLVVPILGMNAFSLDDFANNSFIGVTEGLLSRLNRAQLEAVIAHEAAHVISRDTLIRTIAVSIFGIYGAVLEGLNRKVRVYSIPIKIKDRETYRISIPNPNDLILVAVPYIVARVLYLVGKLTNSLLSRECEYKADAVAVKLARDPLSLAQSLFLISRKWRRVSMGDEYLESLFIVNPAYIKIDEQEGLFADLFSTHPPLSKRLDILLSMAHSDFSSLEAGAKSYESDRYKKPKTAVNLDQQWHVQTEKGWVGPLLAKDILGLGDLRADSLVRKEGSQEVAFFSRSIELNELLKKYHKKAGLNSCPSCGYSLAESLYEGVPVYKCNCCKGYLIEKDKITRIISRREQGFSDEAIRQAKIVEEMAKTLATQKVKIKLDRNCPKCERKMFKTFYTLAYPIEVDRCFDCNLVWFDENELEILQYLIEEATRK